MEHFGTSAILGTIDSSQGPDCDRDTANMILCFETCHRKKDFLTKPLVPLVQAILLCDRVYKDDDSTKCVLAGTFNKVRLAEFPAEYAPATLYINLSDFSGLHKISFRFKRLVDDMILEESPEFEIYHDDRREHHECIFELPPMEFPEPGRYTWEVVFNRTETLGTADVEAVLMEEISPDEFEEHRGEENGGTEDRGL